ncbi:MULTISPECIES: CcdB family protein [unclassified Polynucleobacter]|uniref:CcdB family protein n=1 Tax=unclassified Polynucleobacter TaxID=2640945 RepID=UPI0008AC1A5D|nr:MULTISPECIES: CcdB family protein [unclassified Polynucleobacter]OHC10097.1 MAG: plasmid maintenance protein CcdB [Polynucleobacter sp. GWA2_45_21]HBK43587.1 plasmid maintenance protein CcdB [Polynucleobacter sp.]
MARFSIYENTGEHAKNTPFLVDVQTDLLSGLDTRMVIPLRKASLYKKIKLPQDLIPIFSIKGDEFALETPKMAAVPRKILKKEIGSLKSQQHQIITAIDRLFHGF